jgi:hypothetical protein
MLSVTVITRNEAADIATRMASAPGRTQIIVVDSRAPTKPWRGRAPPRPTASSCREWPGYDRPEEPRGRPSPATIWILSLDADER